MTAVDLSAESSVSRFSLKGGLTADLFEDDSRRFVGREQRLASLFRLKW
jgi:hypothetical protein